MPKLWPAPRRAQNSSAFSLSEAVKIAPDAVTIRTDSRESIKGPCRPWRVLSPAPSVAPKTPTHEAEAVANWENQVFHVS